MLLKRYKVQAIEPTTRARLIAEKKPFHWIITANNLESAWCKFCKQHFGALLPDPSDYDIRLHETVSV